MTNPHGTPIWYELGATDPDAAKRFYEAVAPWTVHAAEPGSPIDYRMIDTGAGDFVGGLARHDTAQSPSLALKPGWRTYFGVDDVDATVARIGAAGGTVHFGPFDLAGVGRMAYVADPQGNAFYVMRGASPENSTAFVRHGTLGKSCWNELSTSDAVAGNAFYAEVFGWTYPDAMTMPGDMGDYTFIDCAGQALGATMKASMPGQPIGWQPYFRVADVDAAAEMVTAHGGTVHMGPMEVPGGERIIVAADPAGTVVGFVAGAGQ
jgi:predicted enzyme related to lactoylglutathione lyase